METIIINQLEDDIIILNLRSNVCVDFTIIFRTLSVCKPSNTNRKMISHLI